MKYLKRTGPSWWRGGGGSVQSLHPKTEAIHAPCTISPPPTPLSHVILRHTPPAPPAQFLLPFHTRPTSSPAHQTHTRLPLSSCTPGPSSYTSTRTHVLSPHTGKRVSTPLHTYAHTRPASLLCFAHAWARAHTHTRTQDEDMAHL